MYPITCLPIRGHLRYQNHKREICYISWSTASCRLFTNIRYCLVLSKSSIVTQFYVVEFPLENEKCRGPYLVPANKVEEENGTTHVLWSVVDELKGSIMEVYYEATCLKQGTKKECSDFLDLLKKNREQADISKLDDYEFEGLAECSTAGKPPTKKAKKATTGSPFNICINEVDEDMEPFDPETEKDAVMENWTKKALSKSEKPKTNGFSRQNSKSAKKPPRENSRRQQRSQREEKINSSQKKKARCETVEAQSNAIEKLMQKGMKLLLHSDNSDEPADISISVSPETTFEGLKRKISETTRISPGNQLLILKGKEWLMEKQEKISQCWTTDDLVAIFEKKDFSSGESLVPSTNFECIKYKLITRFCDH